MTMLEQSKYCPCARADWLVVVMTLFVKLMSFHACLLNPLDGSGGSCFISKKMMYTNLSRVSACHRRQVEVPGKLLAINPSKNMLYLFKFMQSL